MNNPSFIITGLREAGKSTLCLQVLKYLKLEKFIVGGVITLQNKQKWFYLVKENKKIPFEASNTDSYIPIGNFRIHKANLNHVIKNIRNEINSDFLFLDEIGMLEFQKSGYFPILEEVISRNKGNFLVVKQTILSNFIEKYPQVRNYKVITVSDREISVPLSIIKHSINQSYS